MDLMECRKRLDEIDQEIVRLFEERMSVCKQVAEDKIRSGKAVYDGEREKQKLLAVQELAHGAFNKDAVREVFAQLMTISRRYQYGLLAEHGKFGTTGFTEVEEIKKDGVRVVFQGVEGAYSHGSFSAPRLPFTMSRSLRIPCGRWRADGRITQSFPSKTPPLVL